MERFFRSLKSEWTPTIGYSSFNEPQAPINQYIVGYAYTGCINITLDSHQIKQRQSMTLSLIPWPNLLDHHIIMPLGSTVIKYTHAITIRAMIDPNSIPSLNHILFGNVNTCGATKASNKKDG